MHWHNIIHSYLVPLQLVCKSKKYMQKHWHYKSTLMKLFTFTVIKTSTNPKIWKPTIHKFKCIFEYFFVSFIDLVKTYSYIKLYREKILKCTIIWYLLKKQNTLWFYFGWGARRAIWKWSIKNLFLEWTKDTA